MDHTIDGRNHAPVEVGVYPSIYRVLYIQGGFLTGILNHQQIIPYTLENPQPVTVTTRILPFFVGNPYKPLFVTGILGRVVDLTAQWPTFWRSKASTKAFPCMLQARREFEVDGT